MIIDVNESPSALMEFIEEKIGYFRDRFHMEDTKGSLAVSTIEDNDNTLYCVNVFEKGAFNYMTYQGDFLISETIQEYWCQEREMFCAKINISNERGGFDTITGVEKIIYKNDVGYVFDTGFSQVLATDIFDSKVFFMKES